jgi:hypothetical protein
MIDYHFYQLHPFGYHVSNIILHAACALMVYGLTRHVMGKGLPAIFAALIFALHPVQTEAVAYISGRADILVTFFIVGAMLAAFRSVAAKDEAALLWHRLSLASFIAALLSKEVAITLPFLIFAMVPAMSRQRKSGYLWILGLYALLRLTVLNFGRSDAVVIKNPFPADLLTFPKLFWIYLKTYFAPIHLHLEKHVDLVRSAASVEFWVGMTSEHCFDFVVF